MAEKRRKIDKDTDIEITSNVRASFSYLDKKGTSIELDNHGDTEFITFGELKTMASGKYKKTLQNMYVLITDVDDEDFTVDDVLKQLRLDKHYNRAKEILDVDELTVDAFDYFVEIASIEEISKAIKHESLVAVLTESAVDLYKQGEIKLDKTKAVFEACGIEAKYFYDYLSDLSPV